VSEHGWKILAKEDLGRLVLKFNVVCLELVVSPISPRLCGTDNMGHLGDISLSCQSPEGDLG
jgi:hypothetical protein